MNWSNLCVINVFGCFNYEVRYNNNFLHYVMIINSTWFLGELFLNIEHYLQAISICLFV